MGKFVDLTGKRFGRLTVMGMAGRDKFGRITWNCNCDCGNEKAIVGCHLTGNRTVSCGCYNREHNYGKARHTTHNMSHTRIYKIWAGMITRCENERATKYSDYGARGITVCEEWHDFKNFYNWSIENNYSEDLTIDRINVDGNYEPSNCRWATVYQQSNNKRSSIIFEISGERLTLKQISEKYNVNYKKLFARVKYLGWDIEKAIST